MVKFYEIFILRGGESCFLRENPLLGTRVFSRALSPKTHWENFFGFNVVVAVRTGI